MRLPDAGHGDSVRRTDGDGAPCGRITTPGLFPEPPVEVEPAEAGGRTSGPALFVDVALNRPVRTEFTYGVSDELAAQVRPGVRVAVPFGSRREVGGGRGRARKREPAAESGALDRARFSTRSPW